MAECSGLFLSKLSSTAQAFLPGIRAEAQLCGSELAHEDFVGIAGYLAAVMPIREQARSHKDGIRCEIANEQRFAKNSACCSGHR
jgi:hypothetical protein